MRVNPHDLTTYERLHLQTPSSLKVKISTYEFYGGGNIQTIAKSYQLSEEKKLAGGRNWPYINIGNPWWYVFLQTDSQIFFYTMMFSVEDPSIIKRRYWSAMVAVKKSEKFWVGDNGISWFCLLCWLLEMWFKVMESFKQCEC